MMSNQSWDTWDIGDSEDEAKKQNPRPEQDSAPTIPPDSYEDQELARSIEVPRWSKATNLADAQRSFQQPQSAKSLRWVYAMAVVIILLLAVVIYLLVSRDSGNEGPVVAHEETTSTSETTTSSEEETTTSLATTTITAESNYLNSRDPGIEHIAQGLAVHNVRCSLQDFSSDCFLIRDALMVRLAQAAETLPAGSAMPEQLDDVVVELGGSDQEFSCTHQRGGWGYECRGPNSAQVWLSAPALSQNLDADADDPVGLEAQFSARDTKWQERAQLWLENYEARGGE